MDLLGLYGGLFIKLVWCSPNSVRQVSMISDDHKDILNIDNPKQFADNLQYFVGIPIDKKTIKSIIGKIKNNIKNIKYNSRCISLIIAAQEEKGIQLIKKERLLCASKYDFQSKYTSAISKQTANLCEGLNIAKKTKDYLSSVSNMHNICNQCRKHINNITNFLQRYRQSEGGAKSTFSLCRKIASRRNE